MSDKSGWRKKLHVASRPRTPASSKSSDAGSDAGGPSERRGALRRTTLSTQPNRPDTPSGSASLPPLAPPAPSFLTQPSPGLVGPPSPTYLAPPSPSIVNAPSRLSTSMSVGEDDLRSDRSSGTSTPTHDGPRPSTSRHWSSYWALPAPSPKKEEILFSTPWSLDQPLRIPKYNMLEAVSSVHKRLNDFPGEPLPPTYNSSLFRMFADFRELLEGMRLAEETKEAAFEQMRMMEARMKALEDVIRTEAEPSRGGTVRGKQSVGTESSAPNTGAASSSSIPGGHFETVRAEKERENASEMLPQARPRSPSPEFPTVDSDDDILSGRPPSRPLGMTLSQRLKSEYKQAKLLNKPEIPQAPRKLSVPFKISEDPLPDDIETRIVTVGDVRLEGDIFLLLRNLSLLVAYRRHLNPQNLFHKFFALVPNADESSSSESDEGSDAEVDNGEGPSQPVGLSTHPRPRLNSDQIRKRHFSFDPGDDRIDFSQSVSGHHQAADPEPSVERGRPGINETPPRRQSKTSLMQTTTPEAHRQGSKIPSPIIPAAMGRIRSETSTSTHRSVSSWGTPQRSTSQTSVLTAIRHPSSGSQQQGRSRQLSSGSQYRVASGSSSVHNTLFEGEVSHDQTPISELQTNAAALAAARAADRCQGQVAIEEEKSGDDASQQVTLGAISAATAIRPPSRVIGAENQKPSKRS